MNIEHAIAMPQSNGEMSVVKLKFWEFEGSPEDLAKLRLPLPGGVVAPNQDESQPDVYGVAESTAEPGALSEKHVLDVLNRRYLDDRARTLFKFLMQCGDKHPNTAEIAKALDVTRSQLSGVLGALGRRQANTKGWPKDRSIVLWARDNTKKGRRRYFLDDVARHVFESGKYKL